MTNATTISLNKLVPWEGNVRKTEATDTALAELAASIQAHGLLQPLVVRKDKRGKYAVVAGCRRLAALSMIAEEGNLPNDAPIACQLLAEEADATEASLAENAIREDMHPADEFEAFRELADKGLAAADIAARFGTTEAMVAKRLRLARVSPVILQAYRDGDTTLDCVMAFAVTDDREAQERLWKNGPAWMRTHAHSIRRELVKDEIAGSDRRVKYVGMKAYEEAGGAVRRDLFSEGLDGVFILDAALLDSLVTKKLEKAASKLAKEGWKWVETNASFDYEGWSKCERRYADPVPFTKKEEKTFARLEKERDELYDIEDISEEQQAKLDEIEQRIREMQDRDEIWPEETLAVAGAVVSISEEGKTLIERGFIKPEDRKEAKQKKTAASGKKGANGSDHGEQGSKLSASLMTDLTTHRTAALAVTLTEKPEIGLAAVAHAMALPIFYNSQRETCLQLQVSPVSHRLAEGSKSLEALEGRRANWTERLPGEPEMLWAWCIEQDQSVLLDLLAFCAALAIDAVVTKSLGSNRPQFEHADALAKAVKLNMNAWFEPTAANYFSRISKPQILNALQEAKGVPPAPAWSSMKKTELAVLAEREIADKEWLPKPLRVSGGDSAPIVAA